MAVTEKWNVSSLANSLEPGIKALIGYELDKLIDEAVAEATKKVREELLDKCRLKIDSTMGAMCGRSGVEMKVNLTLEVKE